MTKQLPFPCRLRRRQLLLLLQIGVFLCCCNTTAAFAFADAEAEVAASTATSNKMNAGDASTITDDTLDEAIIDPASILLAEYFAANSQEETLFEKAKALTLSRIRALNREMEAMLKPVVMTLFDPQYKATEAMVKLTYHIYVKERRGKDTIVDSEGNIDLEKFERWFIQKMKLADELRQRQRKQILEKNWKSSNRNLCKRSNRQRAILSKILRTTPAHGKKKTDGPSGGVGWLLDCSLLSSMQRSCCGISCFPIENDAINIEYRTPRLYDPGRINVKNRTAPFLIYMHVHIFLSFTYAVIINCKQS